MLLFTRQTTNKTKQQLEQNETKKNENDMNRMRSEENAFEWMPCFK